MRAVVDVEIPRAEQRVAGIGDHHHVVFDEGVELAKQRRDRDRPIARRQRRWAPGMDERRKRALRPRALGEAADEVLHA